MSEFDGSNGTKSGFLIRTVSEACVRHGSYEVSLEQLLWPFRDPVSYHDPLSFLVCSVSHRPLLFLANQPLEKGLEEHIIVWNALHAEGAEIPISTRPESLVPDCLLS